MRKQKNVVGRRPDTWTNPLWWIINLPNLGRCGLIPLSLSPGYMLLDIHHNDWDVVWGVYLTSGGRKAYTTYKWKHARQLKDRRAILKACWPNQNPNTQQLWAHVSVWLDMSVHGWTRWTRLCMHCGAYSVHSLVVTPSNELGKFTNPVWWIFTLPYLEAGAVWYPCPRVPVTCY
mgnify:CR=1 FL=1